MVTQTPPGPAFDRAAAGTRSLLGWGVVVGPIYVLVGLSLAVTRAGFDATSHPLNLLMLGEDGWMQRANLMVSGGLSLVVAAGFGRALAGTTPGRWTAGLLAVFGVGLLGSGWFPPDAVAGFPPGAVPEEASANGILHRTLGALGFIALAVAAQTAWTSATSVYRWRTVPHPDPHRRVQVSA